MFGLERRIPSRNFPASAVDEMMSRFFEEPFFSNFSGSKAWMPSSDILETDDNIRIFVDLPGMKKDDVEIELNEGRILTIKGERKFEEEQRDKYHRVERFYGSFTRSFVLPATVTNEKIAATFKDGVLEILLPKSEAARSRRITINS